MEVTRGNGNVHSRTNYTMMMTMMTMCVYVQSWTEAAAEVISRGPTSVVRGLRPNTPYVFVVRARNSHGLGAPSHPSKIITTTGINLDKTSQYTPSPEGPAAAADIHLHVSQRPASASVCTADT